MREKASRTTNPPSLGRAIYHKTCQKCHEGATRRFAGYLTHATHHDPKKYPFLYYTFWGMTCLLIGTFLVGGLHTVLWFPRALELRRERDQAERAAEAAEREAEEAAEGKAAEDAKAKAAAEAKTPEPGEAEEESP